MLCQMNSAGYPRQRTVTHQGFPKTITCGGQVSSSETTPEMTSFLRTGVEYWNTAWRLANEQTNQTGGVPPFRLINHLDEADEYTVRVGLCQCPDSGKDGRIGEYSGNLICLDKKLKTGSTGPIRRRRLLMSWATVWD